MKIIAESGSNHNGNSKKLYDLALASKNAGADYFTFQMFDPESFCVVDYERFDIVKSIAFSQEVWDGFIDYCISIDLNLIPCALDIKSFKFCVSKNLKFFKIHATDITNIPFLKVVKDSNVSVILETQCATFQDISIAKQYLGESIDTIIHGYSDYPTDIENLNLNALDYIRSEYQCNVGFADHSLDVSAIPLMALAKGIQYLEKHITTTRADREYDWQVSLYPNEFSSMVSTVAHYQKALGNTLKHPNSSEAKYRGVLYKKVVGNDIEKEFKRSDYGNDYLTEVINSFSIQRFGIPIIARLKSKRLAKKVLLPFTNDTLIKDLYNRLKENVNGYSNVTVLTSYLEEDTDLVHYCERERMNVYRGHPVSVIDRLLSYAIDNKLGVVCRITGDNPYTDPEIINEMYKLIVENELDYVKASNVPMGVGAEMYTTSYLWSLYLKMDNPLTSEYLAWIALNDENSKKGVVEVKFNDESYGLYNLSVDYKEDYDRGLTLYNEIGINDFKHIQLKDILSSVDKLDKFDGNMIIKLPGSKECTLNEFNKLIDNANYIIRADYRVG